MFVFRTRTAVRTVGSLRSSSPRRFQFVSQGLNDLPLGCDARGTAQTSAGFASHQATNNRHGCVAVALWLVSPYLPDRCCFLPGCRGASKKGDRFGRSDDRGVNTSRCKTALKKDDETYMPVRGGEAWCLRCSSSSSCQTHLWSSLWPDHSIYER